MVYTLLKIIFKIADLIRFRKRYRLTMRNEKLFMGIRFKIEFSRLCLLGITDHLIIVDKDNCCRLDTPDLRRLDDQYAFRVKAWKEERPGRNPAPPNILETKIMFWD